MSSKLKFIIFIIAFAIIIGTAAIIFTTYTNRSSDDAQTSPDTTTSETEPEKQLAPDFKIVDREGKELKLSDMRGKPVILNFWASWCGPCKSEMPDFDAAFKKYGNEINFMMVNLTDGSKETIETASTFIDGTDYTFPVYFDTASQGAAAYGVSSIPVTYFIDAEGYLVAYGKGMLSADALQSGIDMLFE